jgi:hypothetical protein
MSKLSSLRLHDPVWRTPLVQWRLSAELARLTGAQDDQCWSNALRAAALASERLGEPVWWVEGVAVARTGALALVHGWLEAEDGLVLDPTPAWCARPAVRGRRYLRLATVDPTELHAARAVVGPWGPVLRFPLSHDAELFAELQQREQAAVGAAVRAARPGQLWRGALAHVGGPRIGQDPFGLDWR